MRGHAPQVRLLEEGWIHIPTGFRFAYYRAGSKLEIAAKTKMHSLSVRERYFPDGGQGESSDALSPAFPSQGYNGRDVLLKSP